MTLDEFYISDQWVKAIINGKEYAPSYVSVISKYPEHQIILSLKEFDEILNLHQDKLDFFRISIEVPNFDNISFNYQEHKSYDVCLLFPDGKRNFLLGLCGGEVELKESLVAGSLR